MSVGRLCWGTLLQAVGLLLALALPAAPARALSARVDPARWVDPFIGTDGTGHVLPGAMRPFGMVAPSPDNAGGGWDYTAGYQYRAPRILGFSNTHMSGTGIPDLGDVLLQPATGRPWTVRTQDFASDYDKRSETAAPGGYAVTLRRYAVRVELTATQRVALHRYTFARPGTAQVLVDLQHGLHYGEQPRVQASTVDTDARPGEISGRLHVQGWTDREVAFVVRFDRAPVRIERLPFREGEKAARLLLTFELGRERQLQARVALSTVDVEGARANLREAEGRRFEQVQAEARAEWNALLSRVRIEAPERFKRIFYSALYRCFMHPSDIADADGRVRGPTGAVVRAPAGHYYSTLSLWDTFRALHPLLTLLVPERVDGFVQTLIAHQQAQGYLPLWTAWGRETHTMIGNPAMPVIADALAKGFGGFDRDAALQALLQTSTAERPAAPPWAQHGWALLDEYGYLPFDRADGESVSKTLEYGIGDDALARVARTLGRTDLAERFAARAASWRQLWDPDTRMMRGKDSQGRWRTPFDPLVPTSPLNNPGDYTEANAWQYTLTPALHDPEGLVAQMGSPQAFEAWLDRFFSVQAPGDNKHLGQEALIGQYAHGNEPSHHAAYLYAWTGAPWKGHALVRQIVRRFYRDRPDGITGNDDCGQMSAWLVLSTLGFYPVVASSGEYVLGAPQVRRAWLQLAGGRSLDIRTRGVEDGLWAAEVRRDGRSVAARSLSHAELLRGGELLFVMRPLP